jgi:hypothetical protein
MMRLICASNVSGLLAAKDPVHLPAMMVSRLTLRCALARRVLHASRCQPQPMQRRLLAPMQATGSSDSDWAQAQSATPAATGAAAPLHIACSSCSLLLLQYA